ncbi:GlcNAc-PI de-N-acetylase [Limimonas halophila]|uniref:GlcNAc-PI de-N-acetylase n=1 Tax=Limimonas halophila TaxID=1082479 RepID=A0A1G7RUZ8_9PROT|nr:PIG-L family deacetylase [Limimonas halophila]SDG14571.1 GlcNAc-PI de-N-acetylase [Limimonas halophila]
MQTDPTILDDCTVVMAHPDDECLWASSAVARSRQVVLCYGNIGSQPGLSQRRQAAMQAFPLANTTFLAVPESEVFSTAAWPLPGETWAGLRCRRNNDTYESNCERLIALLREHLRGVKTVVTHNPWGEYGHEEHVQVFRAVMRLQQEFGFSVLVSGYCSNLTVLLAQRHLGRFSDCLAHQPTDMKIAKTLRDHYIKHGCWTWFKDYAWPDYEHFFVVDPAAASAKRPQTPTIQPLMFVQLPAPMRVSFTLDPFTS